jgi:DGQHR domain-containing protein
MASQSSTSVQAISVIVPRNPFVPPTLQNVRHCLAALDVEKLMQWWPGTPHEPHRDAQKVRAIQRSLDWKRVAQIGAYLLQQEIVDAPHRLDRYFRVIYEAKSRDPGREWPPRVPRVVGYQRSEYPTFSNVLLHVNGAKIHPITDTSQAGTAKLVFDEKDPRLNFTVIDGQHRINGAFFAIKIRRETKPSAEWDIPAEIFLDLDQRGEPPRRQAQIFIDVNFYQKKVDRSLVADLFPTARGERDPLDNKERAQDLGRKLMLETGPLVGMIQIPGVRFGVKDVVALATLNAAINDVIDDMFESGIQSLEGQAKFLSLCLDAWLESTGRKQEVSEGGSLEPENVAYQGRVVVSFLTLIPACIWKIRQANVAFTSDEAKQELVKWLRGVMKRAGLLRHDRFVAKSEFSAKGFLGSGGVAKFRDTLWAAAIGTKSISRLKDKKRNELAEQHRKQVRVGLSKKR